MSAEPFGVAALRERRAALERELTSRLQAFERETGLNVASVSLEVSATWTNFGDPKIPIRREYRLSVEVTL